MTNHITTDIHSIFKDDRGALLPIEHIKLPFFPVRSFIVTGAGKGHARGGHAHKKTQQYLLCVQGKIEVTLLVKFDSEKYYTLREGQGIFVDKMVWDKQRFLTGNDILVVYCSTPYDKDDYILELLDFYNLHRQMQ